MDRAKGQTAILCAAAALLVLSDCTSLLGSWAYALKYPGIVVLALSCLFTSAARGVSHKRIVLGFIAIAILLVAIPFQSASFSKIQAIGLYLMVAVIACFSQKIFSSSAQLANVCIFLTILVLMLLALSFNNVVSQFIYYVSLGRPRIQGCFSNPNSLGNIAAMVMIGLVSTILSGRISARRRKVVLLCAILCLAIVVASGSRTALIVALSFVLCYALIRAIGTAHNNREKVFYLLVLMGLLVISVLLVLQPLSEDQTFMLRFNSLLALSIDSPQALVGIGYVSSEGISQLTSAAGGKTDMLYVSLYYRVGIIGCLAYVLLVVAALSTEQKKTSKARCIALALLLAVALQGVGESYLSSVMSFVSCFDWIALSAFPFLAMEDDAT